MKKYLIIETGGVIRINISKIDNVLLRSSQLYVIEGWFFHHNLESNMLYLLVKEWTWYHVPKKRSSKNGKEILKLIRVTPTGVTRITHNNYLG